MSFPAIVGLFGAGVASFLSPCVIPLIPAYVTMALGSSAENGQHTRPSGTGLGSTELRGAAGFVLGFASVFALLGALAGLLGSATGDSQDWTRRVGGVLLIGFGVLLLGVLRWPERMQWRLIGRLPAQLGPARAIVLGVAFGAAWTPCVGPLLGAALVVAAGSGTAGAGAVLLAAYALGVTVPFVVTSFVVVLARDSWRPVGALLARSSGVLQRVGGVMLIVLGVILVLDRYSWLGDVTRLA